MDSSGPVVWVVTCVVVPLVSVALYLVYQGKSKSSLAAAQGEAEFSPGYVQDIKPPVPVNRHVLTSPFSAIVCLREPHHLTALPAHRPDGDRVFTAEELKAFDGSDESQPVYIALKGTVFDVSARREMYAPGQGYSVFAGRDASKVWIAAFRLLKVSVQLQKWIAFFCMLIQDAGDFVQIGCLRIGIV